MVIKKSNLGGGKNGGHVKASPLAWVDGWGGVRYKYTYFFIKTMKNVNFGGEKKPGGNAKASPLAWGRGESNQVVRLSGCQVHVSDH